MARILIVDDERPIRSTLKEILEFEKYKADEAADGEEAIEMMIKTKYDVVLCDIKMPKMDGTELFQKAKELELPGKFIMISAHGNIETAVDAVKNGAYDFISKPPDLNRLLITVKNALENHKLEDETKTLRKKVSRKYEMIGTGAAMKELTEICDKVAPTDARVLIMGPNGAGKELVARRIHELSTRANGPLIEVNCAAIPSELIESELFGYEKGSFTSAIKQHIGRFEQAEGGTLFLDEIGDMSLSTQAKVLRALQERKITRVGGDKDIPVDVRVVAATNKDLKQEIENKTFREDLYHRLGVIIIKVPSLMERTEDIPLLIEKFLADISEDQRTKPKKMEPAALELLKNYTWTGNVRELRNVTERLVILGKDIITEEDVRKYVLTV